MRMIDADALQELCNKRIKDTWNSGVAPVSWAAAYADFKDDIDSVPTITPPNEWVSVEDELPKLPDRDWCAVMVNTAQKGNPKSRPMIYERAIVRGKRVERWKYYWDRIADELPDYWMYLPKPPKKET